jgi:hypothetical protein
MSPMQVDNMSRDTWASVGLGAAHDAYSAMAHRARPGAVAERHFRDVDFHAMGASIARLVSSFEGKRKGEKTAASVQECVRYCRDVARVLLVCAATPDSPDSLAVPPLGAEDAARKLERLGALRAPFSK